MTLACCKPELHPAVLCLCLCQCSHLQSCTCSHDRCMCKAICSHLSCKCITVQIHELCGFSYGVCVLLPSLYHLQTLGLACPGYSHVYSQLRVYAQGLCLNTCFHDQDKCLVCVQWYTHGVSLAVECMLGCAKSLIVPAWVVAAGQ